MTRTRRTWTPRSRRRLRGRSREPTSTGSHPRGTVRARPDPVVEECEAMSTTVYSVSHSEGHYYVPTKADALREAREARAAGDLYVSITKNVVTDAYRSR